MTLLDKLEIPGIHHVTMQGHAGDLEVVLEVPAEVGSQYLAILGHPHSLQGGTMNNKVVAIMARAFRELGVASIRFNFRGVGQSAGTYDAGIGESEDMLHLLSLCEPSNRTVFFAGFSFGSYVAFRALTLYQEAFSYPSALITIAPSVQHYDYTLDLPPQTPWLVVIGKEDEVVPVTAVEDFVQSHPLQPNIEYFNDTGHFFHGKLLDLKDCLQRYLREWMV
ncbi:MAG: hypothetical protein NXI01_08270 [Gammaproteobacteria bacterium]|nr:hypothetical protein [Gammaproteobacteria bacterium]